MYKKEKFPFAMTKKSLVAYIIFTVLMGLFLFFIRGDMEGKLAACIVCPILILYFIYTYCKERKADAKADETKMRTEFIIQRSIYILLLFMSDCQGVERFMMLKLN